MSEQVSEAFRSLLKKIEPSRPEYDARLRHGRSIRQALEAGFKSVAKVEVIGSHARGSAIRFHSDVDYLAVLSKKDVEWGHRVVKSPTILRRVRDLLAARYPDTQVSVRSPAVIVHFADGEGAVDVVPGYWCGTVSKDKGHPVYAIPEPSGGWMSVSPHYHNSYIATKAVSTAGKLAGAARLVKAWKHARSAAIPCLGVHVELLLATSGTCRGVRTYASILEEAFRLLRDRGGSALNDPTRVSVRIDAARSDAERKRLVDAASLAAQRAAYALDADEKGNTKDALKQWNFIFNGAFGM